MTYLVFWWLAGRPVLVSAQVMQSRETLLQFSRLSQAQ